MSPHGGGGVLITRPVVWDPELHFLFVNCEGCLQLRVGVEDQAGHAIPLLNVSDSVPFSGDSSRQLMRWETPHDTHGLAPVAGRVVRLRFEMRSGRLFSFWLAATACGESRGFVGGGGPGLDGNRDQWGSCDGPKQ